MRTKFITLIMAACCLTAVSSCSNAEIEEKGKADANGRIELSVKGVLGEFKTEETKSSLVNNLRVGWADDDKVLVFHKESKKYLGVLTAAIIGTDDRTAMLSGTIATPEGSDKTLVFVHGTGLQATDFTANQTYESVTLDLSVQGEKTPFLVFGTAPYVAETISNMIVDFSFATSVVSTYAAGLPEGKAVTKAVLGSINTKCVLDISTLAVSGSTSDTITKSDGIGSTNDKGQVLFEIAVPASEAAASDRSVEFTVDGKSYTAAFSSAAITSGKAYSAMSESHSAEYVAFDKASTAVHIDSTEALTVTVYPAKAISALTWTSSNDEVATVDQTGKVTGVAAGTVTITATSKDDSSIKATCTVTVKGFDIVEIGGLKWRKMNLGAETVNDYGNLYSWGNVDGQSGNSGYDPTFTSGNYTGTAGGNINNSTVLWDKEKNDAAYKELGGSWRMPTKDEFIALDKACGGTGENNQSMTAITASHIDNGKVKKGRYWLEASQTVLSGIDELKNITAAGMLYSDGENYLFFPAAGGSSSDSRSNGGSRGDYWSSTWFSSDHAYLLSFNSSNVYPQGDYGRYYGRSVRPVSD